VWRLAGLERDATGLRELLDDPHPLARLVARCALAREEFPNTDPELDARHTILDPGADAPRFEAWPS
jgi:L-aspartate oxidase